MEYCYLVTQKQSEICVVYGIALALVQDGSMNILYSVEDICSEPSQLSQLVQLCNDLHLDPIHLQDVIDDFLAAQ